MATKVCFGIPHRVGACACELGRGRGDKSVQEVTETTTTWTNAVANKTIDPGHSIVSVTYTDAVPNDGKNDGANRLVVNISCWTKYDDQEIDSENPPDKTNPKLIYKIKGDIKDGVSGSFPSIKISMRPLKTVLDYSYAGNLNASGEGEIGYGSGGNGQPGPNDNIIVNHFEGSTPIPPPSGENWESLQQEAYQENLEEFKDYINDTMQGGVMLTLNETHFFKQSDRSSDDESTFEPLNGREILPTLYPNTLSRESFDFTRNETWDCRYIYPANYLTKYGTLSLKDGWYVELPEVPNPEEGAALFAKVEVGDWEWKTIAQIDSTYVPPLNPEFTPDLNDIFLGQYNIREGIAPVIKGWYWDSPQPPANGFKALFASENLKFIKDIRKRYTFSFRAQDTRGETYSVTDHTVGNVLYFYDNENAGGGYLGRKYAFYEETVEKENSFEAVAWWRMEVNAELCRWNSKKTKGVDKETGQEKEILSGATIKGVIKLKAKKLVPSQSLGPGFYSGMPYTLTSYYRYYPFYGIAPSFIYRCEAEQYFDEDFVPRYVIPDYDAGEIPWEVTLDKDNAKGKPIKFLDFAIPLDVELPGGGNPMVYISDFIVQEVILP